jgi:NAD(P)-dependent dehydrogenase (short-subunit alcohol dehydrogenase family)
MAQVWLITGSSRGLGRALAEAALAEGHQLVATARNPARLDELVRRYDNRVRPVALDVTDVRAAHDAVNVAVDTFGRLDVVVNNAGYGDVGSIEETSDAIFRAQIDTNLFGVVNVTRAAIPIMRQQRAGHIIQITTIGGRLGTPGLSAYQTAKWGVEGFTEVLANEVAPLGIKATIIEPGGFRTDWAGSSMTIREFRPEYDATIGAMVRYNREQSGKEPGDPARAAAVIVHIASLDDPPLRLVLGSRALQLAEQIEAARAASDQKWRELSVSTDFGAYSLKKRSNTGASAFSETL